MGLTIWCSTIGVLLLRSQDLSLAGFEGFAFVTLFMNVRFEFPISLYTFGYRDTCVRMYVVHNSKTAVDVCESRGSQQRRGLFVRARPQSLSELGVRRLSNVVKYCVEGY
jgi:hypothetical protein